MGLLKKVFFFLTILFFSGITLIVTPLKCVSMNNQECRVRLKIVNINSDEPAFFLLSIKTSKCSGSCDDVKNPYVVKT